jgi:hypothetical protein
MRRSFRTHLSLIACSQGCTLGWYAMPRWGMGPMATPDAGDAPLGHGIDGNTGWRRRPVGVWNRWRPPDAHDAPSRHGIDGEPVVYAMPRWGMGPKTPPDASDPPLGHGTDDASLRMRVVSCCNMELAAIPIGYSISLIACSWGSPLGWYAMPRWGRSPLSISPCLNPFPTS